MDKKQMPKKPKFNPTWIYVGIAALFLILSFIDFGASGKEISWKQFISMIKAHDVEKIIVVNGDFAEIYLTEDAITSQRYKDIIGQNKPLGRSFFSK